MFRVDFGVVMAVSACRFDVAVAFRPNLVRGAADTVRGRGLTFRSAP